MPAAKLHALCSSVHAEGPALQLRHCHCTTDAVCTYVASANVQDVHQKWASVPPQLKILEILNLAWIMISCRYTYMQLALLHRSTINLGRLRMC